jgi:hypothetical protein
MEVPIACRLEDGQARDQLEAWRVLLDHPTVTARRISPTEAVIGVTEGLELLPDLVRLAQREKACCPFFDFRLEIEADRIDLVMSVPADGAFVLDNFVRGGAGGIPPESTEDSSARFSSNPPGGTEAGVTN